MGTKNGVIPKQNDIMLHADSHKKTDSEIKETESPKRKQSENEPPSIDGEKVEELEDWQRLKELVIGGTLCDLVPYTKDHVARYNKWLNDPYIQQMTQTEPYSLSQEYEYQNEWKMDEHKYIFIVLDKSLDDAMCGDINIFIQDEHIGELNIMIAEKQSRGKGIATETLQLIIGFATKHLEIKKFIAKIQSDNIHSIKLFKKLGFRQTEYIDAFKEYTFTLILDEENLFPFNKKKAINALNTEQYNGCNGNVKPNTVKYTD